MGLRLHRVYENLLVFTIVFLTEKYIGHRLARIAAKYIAIIYLYTSMRSVYEIACFPEGANV